MQQNQLIDPFGRIVDYVRISVTDRCDFRCVYCMSEQMTFLPKKDLLTLEEIAIVCDSFIELGTKKIRLTGGEPLVRRNIMHLIKHLGTHVKKGKLEEITITTNGSQLHKFSDLLFEAGVRRINVSIDTLDPEKFERITRWGKLDVVLNGLDAAKKAGLKIKLNTVALKGINDDELSSMLNWAGEQNFDMTIIEVMPMGDIGSENRLEQYISVSEIYQKLSQQFSLIQSTHQSPGPARYFDVANTGNRLGLITPLSHNFCESCNRVRMTCTGKLYLCLGQDDNTNLAVALRSGGKDRLKSAIIEAIGRKPLGHDFMIERGLSNKAVSRHMSVTGG